MRGGILVVLSAAALLALGAGPAWAGIANAGIPGAPSGDPLAGLPWGVHKSQYDPVFAAYQAAAGTRRRLLALIALRPKADWFGSWFSDPDAQSIAHAHIAQTTGGDPNVLVQMTIFRMQPWEEDACKRLPTQAEQASYKRWIDGFAAGIGDTRVALVLQPDLPFGACVPHHSTLPLRLIAYSARVFSALPHTTVYVDAGSADWVTVQQAASLLRDAGVQYARGFSLNDTHYDSTSREIVFGARIVKALAAAHLPGKHFVINTAANGRGFTYQQWHGFNFAEGPACATRSSQRCVTLGIPPSWHVADPRWGLPRRARALAARYADAYLWIGRPWLFEQGWPFELQRALQLARTTPF